MINNKYELKVKLKEILQPNNEIIDFGFYRIINFKQKKIEYFIENELINELDKQLEKFNIPKDLEIEIYNYLVNFFSRYYDKGYFTEFGKKYIPSNGKEILFHWINKDQYYVKTMEYFRKYTFDINGLTINFKIVNSELEKDNVKPLEKKFFVLNEKIYSINYSMSIERGEE
jgi:hypothetical protein